MSIRSMMSKHSSLLLSPLARITHGFLNSGGETTPRLAGETTDLLACVLTSRGC